MKSHGRQQHHSTSNIQHSTFNICVFIFWALAASCARPEQRRYNVLLITLDTFRADRIGPLTPNLRNLAGESVRFANADSPVPLTLPAHCSILSGELPLHHGVRNNGANPFPPDRETLATAFSRGGYRTGAFVSSFVLDHRFGLARGFDHYDDEIPRDMSNAANNLEAERRGDMTVDRALAWLRQSGARPFFAWVHLYDAHAPYAPPPPYPQSYDGEIAFVDAQVGRLLANIDRSNTLIAVVGDHGEALGEHGELTHGLLIYEPTLHVPMMIAVPGAQPRELLEPISTVDLAPTIATLAEAKFEERHRDGRDISSFITGRGEPPRSDLYAETEYPLQFGWSDLTALRRGNEKLINAPTRELYDLGRDPRESTNVLLDQRRAFRDLARALAAIVKTAAAVAATAPVDEETRSKLASLGYIAPTAVASRSNRPDPVKMAPLFRQFEEATWALNGGRPREALAILERLVAADPANPIFRETLARSLRQQGQLEPAIRLYREAVAMSPDSAEAWYNLAVALQEGGHVKEGGIAVREAIRRDDARPEAHNALGIALTTEGDLHGAEQAFRRTIALDPRNARAWNNLGNALRAMNRFDEARDAYEHAIAISPGYADPLNGLGVVDVQQDHARDAIPRFDAALRIAPDFYEAQLNRGIALKMAGDVAGARRQLSELLARLPNSREFDDERKAARALLAQ
jgi:arylsulfatase A-like enzyme/Flp pilus assembly protein TadD